MGVKKMKSTALPPKRLTANAIERTMIRFGATLETDVTVEIGIITMKANNVLPAIEIIGRKKYLLRHGTDMENVTTAQKNQYPKNRICGTV
jgi:hypothetical protein